MKKFIFFIYSITFFFSVSAEPFDPIALYLTWTQNPATTMTIQWITLKDRPSDEVVFKPKDEQAWSIALGKHVPLPYSDKYLVHAVELKDLQPNSEYVFRAGYDGVSFKFRTMPSSLDSPISFVVGGDIYNDDIQDVIKMNKQAAKMCPRFVLVGGDLAYATNSHLDKKEDCERWITWLKSWKQDMVTSDGCMIPLLPVIGNHDTMGHDGQTPQQAQCFYALFSMPGKQGYNVLDFGDYLSLILLDSGHTHAVEGIQTEWLKETIKQRNNTQHKFAIYHVGAFPSYRLPDGKTSTAIRTHWVPLFEQHQLSAAFEHHDHSYKRTFPLKNNKIDANGVVYMGDGAWGVKPRKPKRRWYLAKSAAINHVILVTLSEQARKYQAIDSKGILIDEFIQNLH